MYFEIVSILVSVANSTKTFIYKGRVCTALFSDLSEEVNQIPQTHPLKETIKTNI